LLIGGYAVGYYGYSRATADMDIWIAINPDNAQKVTGIIAEFFGFKVEDATPELFLQENKVARMGVPPFRIEVLTTISGVVRPESWTVGKHNIYCPRKETRYAPPSSIQSGVQGQGRLGGAVRE
jgi:hypothetical protein